MASDSNDIADPAVTECAEDMGAMEKKSDKNSFTVGYSQKDSTPWMQFVAEQSKKGNGKSENNGKRLSFSGPKKYLKLAKFMINLLSNKNLKAEFLQVGIDFLNKNDAKKGSALLSKMGFPKPTPNGFSKGQRLDEDPQQKGAGNDISKKEKDLGKFLTNVLKMVAKMFGVSLNPTAQLSDVSPASPDAKRKKNPFAIELDPRAKLRPKGAEEK